MAERYKAGDAVKYYGDGLPEGLVNLPGGNMWARDFGYAKLQVPAEKRRDRPEHWDGVLATNPESFRKSWEPRSGPLEFVYKLANQKREYGDTDTPFIVYNLGGGIGDFSVNLAQIPGVHVFHVDFSPKANSVARILAEEKKVLQPEKMDIVTSDTRAFLRGRLDQGNKADLVFFYGGLGENTPREQDVRETLCLGAQALREGGHLWYVGLQQPRLIDATDIKIWELYDREQTVTFKRSGERVVRPLRDTEDILGEYPDKPGFVTGVLSTIEDMHLVDEIIGEARPDDHVLVPGGAPQEHVHTMHRAVYAKGRVSTPVFDFKKAVNPNWVDIWQGLAAAK